jgi:hypothetical protein
MSPKSRAARITPIPVPQWPIWLKTTGHATFSNV